MSEEVVVPSGNQLYEGYVLAERPERCARVLFGGDTSPVRSLESPLGGAGAVAIWDGMRDVIAGADVFAVNLECPLTTSWSPILKDGPLLRAAPSSAEGLRAGGVNVAILANNHVMDMGRQGVLDTIATCRSSGIDVVGAGENLGKAIEPLILTRSGIRIALVALAEQEFSIATADEAGAAPMSPLINIRQLRRARASADIVIASVHGGNEYFDLPRPGLVEYCRFLAENGADAVVCHHTHVAAPVEIHKGVPIAYSLGNLLFDNPGGKPRSWHHGYLLELVVSAHAVVSVRAFPFEQCDGHPGLARMRDEAEFLCAVQERGKALLSPCELDRAWRTFCRETKERYLLGLRAPILFPGVGALFRRFPSLYRLLLPQRRRLGVLGLVQCQSHTEALRTLLSEVGK